MPCPKESKSTFQRSFALWARDSASSYVSGRTPSAVLPSANGLWSFAAISAGQSLTSEILSVVALSQGHPHFREREIFLCVPHVFASSNLPTMSASKISLFSGLRPATRSAQALPALYRKGRNSLGRMMVTTRSQVRLSASDHLVAVDGYLEAHLSIMKELSYMLIVMNMCQFTSSRGSWEAVYCDELLSRYRYESHTTVAQEIIIAVDEVTKRACRQGVAAIVTCSSCHAAMQAGSSDPRGSGGTASETKQKYTLKSEGGGTYKVEGGQQINVSMSRP